MKTYHLIGPNGGYWRPGGKGYTTDIKEAGVFTEDDSQMIVSDTHGEHRRVEVKEVEPGAYISISDMEYSLLAAIENLAGIGESSHLSGQLTRLRINLVYLRRHGTLEVKP